ncbi:hypothetical protein AB1N83_003165 [Pleurotus pulmonarius]
MHSISNVVPSNKNKIIQAIRPYIMATMAKHPWIDAKSRFLFLPTLADEVKAYRSSIWRHAPLNLIVQAVTELTKHTPTQSSITTHRVHEQVELFGQYAILSHRWGVEELSFDDVANLSDPRVRGKKGFKKLEGFSWAVKSLYGCRYLWMDTSCIDEADRNASIPLMFNWYRHAYVCVIYLSTGKEPSDPWGTRGWTLQELLAASRIRYVASDWWPVVNRGLKFDTWAWRAEGNLEPSTSFQDLVCVTGGFVWKTYEPGVHQAIPILEEMHTRQTSIPEDMVYSILSALDLNIPVKYGEGFDAAFHRLQLEILAQTNVRRFLSWTESTPSRYNSMLPGGFPVWKPSGTWKDTYHEGPAFHPKFFFESSGVMRIMLSLYPPPSTFPYDAQNVMFALMGEISELTTKHHRGRVYYVGVLLRRVGLFHGEVYFPEGVYQRKRFKQYDKSQILAEVAPQWVYIV